MLLASGASPTFGAPGTVTMPVCAAAGSAIAISNAMGNTVTIGSAPTKLRSDGISRFSLTIGLLAIRLLFGNARLGDHLGPFGDIGAHARIHGGRRRSLGVDAEL